MDASQSSISVGSSRTQRIADAIEYAKGTRTADVEDVHYVVSECIVKTKSAAQMALQLAAVYSAIVGPTTTLPLRLDVRVWPSDQALGLFRIFYSSESSPGTHTVDPTGWDSDTHRAIEAIRYIARRSGLCPYELASQVMKQALREVNDVNYICSIATNLRMISIQETRCSPKAPFNLDQLEQLDLSGQPPIVEKDQ